MANTIEMKTRIPEGQPRDKFPTKHARPWYSRDPSHARIETPLMTHEKKKETKTNETNKLNRELVNHSCFSKSMVNNNSINDQPCFLRVHDFEFSFNYRESARYDVIEHRHTRRGPKTDEKDSRASRSNSGSRGFSHGWPPLAAWQGQHRYTFSATRRELRSPRLPTRRFGGRTPDVAS